MTQRYQYAVMFRWIHQVPHRGPMTKREAQDWIRAARKDSPELPKEFFYVARRPVGRWERDG
jgi:hypothetical protein